MRRNRKYNILKERVNMDRKPKPDTYVEPMPQKLFHQLVKQFQELGGKVIMGADAELYLDSREAEACTLNGYTILFRKRPGRAAVYEEMIHEFFDSVVYADKYKKDEKLADKPIDADANGAYCIALKGLYEILQIKNNWKEGEVFSRDALKITNADWLRFMQSRGFE